ncbi:MAG: hypothetical protein VKK04_14555, partial [Synechococcales bacterium]|nr:hypothetical protein [Synechococcales bacterium]
LSRLRTYGGPGQNRNIRVSLSEDATALRMQGNGWRRLPVNYTITPDTMLSLEFRSSAEGEIHAIGFDQNNQISGSDRQNSFQLFGVQDWGIDDFAVEMASKGWQKVEIPVGDYFTGSMRYLTFANDHDVANPTAVSEFRNIQLFEAPMGMDSATNKANAQSLEGGMTKALETLTLAPSNL